MTTHETVQRDERTVAVENASYRAAYALVTFALLLDMAYRGAFRNEAAWDLMALVVAGGAVCSIHQARQNTLARGWPMKVALVACVAAVIAFIVAFVKGM